MDAQETRANNKVLAELMSDMEGWEFLYESEGYKFYRNPWQKSYPAYDENLEVVGALYAGDCNFKFHQSWDWLMPVIEKIETMEITIPAKYRSGFFKRTGQATGFVSIDIFFDERAEFKGWASSVGFALGGGPIWENSDRYKNKINAFYAAALGFIQWYNEQPKTDA